MSDNPPPIPEELISGVMVYVRWVRDIVNLINRKVVSIEAVDSSLGYKVFIILNNPHIQEMEFEKYSNYYHPFYECYKKWKNYRIKTNQPIPWKNTIFQILKVILNILETKNNCIKIKNICV